jgi:hypothetical protein
MLCLSEAKVRRSNLRSFSTSAWDAGDGLPGRSKSSRRVIRNLLNKLGWRRFVQEIFPTPISRVLWNRLVSYSNFAKQGIIRQWITVSKYT